MGLFLAQTQGTNNFRFATAQTHVISIARMDTGVGFANATTTIEGIVCSQVTYAPTLAGPTITRLNALVNNVGYVSPPQVVILAVPAGTVFNGVMVSAIAGIALRPGAAGSPFASHISTIYDADDCDGQGHWVDKDGGGTTSFPPDVILYHELAHCFHFATGVATSEPLAETDENDLRDARGLPRRNTASHNGGCGGGPTSCCIVASLATGSSYSAEIRRFRNLRENTLRQSSVGDAFFKEFFFRYYGFSPEVTRLMGRRANLRPLIKERFVMPLLAGVEMLVHYADNNGKGLAEFLRRQSGREGLSEICQKNALDELSGYLKIVRNFNGEVISEALKGKGRAYSGFKELLRHVNGKTLKDEYIEWSLIAVVELWVESALLLYSDKHSAEIDFEVYEKIVRWIALMPVSSVWREFSRLETEFELQNLEQFIFDPRSKKTFANRLVKTHSRHAETIQRWAEAEGR